MEVLKKRLIADTYDIRLELIINAIKDIEADLGLDNPIESYYKDEIKKALNESESKIAEGIATMEKNTNELINEVIDSKPKDLNLVLDKELARLMLNFKSRAKTIAQTAVSNAYNTSRASSIDRQGLKKMWISQRNGKNRRVNHISYDGTIADKEGYFHVGGDKMKYPTGGSIAKENINCQCFVVATK